jgi:beta-lactamase class D
MTSSPSVVWAWSFVLAVGAGAAGSEPAATAAPAECVIIGAAGNRPTVSGAAECDRPTAPASTFKIPHALLALQLGVIAPATVVDWDGSAGGPDVWRKAHTVVSAIRWSVLPFFQHTARLIGAARMREGLRSLGYAADSFDGDVATFWLNGDLVVTPREQFAFLERLVAGHLPIDAVHRATVREALRMPPGQVTNASGTHAFPLAWPGDLEVRAKTGNTEFNGERVSWLVGSVRSNGVEHVVVARVRAPGALDGTAGLDAARRGLDAYSGRQGRP